MLLKRIRCPTSSPTFPRVVECIGAPESARLLGRSLAELVQTMDRQDIMAAALQLQLDDDLQVLGQYVTSLSRMSEEVLRLAFGLEVFPLDMIDNAAPVPRVHRTATQMAAMGLWRSPVGLCDPGPIPVSSCSDCLGCLVCSRGWTG